MSKPFNKSATFRSDGQIGIAQGLPWSDFFFSPLPSAFCPSAVNRNQCESPDSTAVEMTLAFGNSLLPECASNKVVLLKQYKAGPSWGRGQGRCADWNKDATCCYCLGGFEQFSCQRILRTDLETVPLRYRLTIFFFSAVTNVSEDACSQFCVLLISRYQHLLKVPCYLDKGGNTHVDIQ